MVDLDKLEDASESLNKANGWCIVHCHVDKIDNNHCVCRFFSYSPPSTARTDIF